MSVGGSIESLEILGRNFAVTADADASVKLGGFENEKQANGDGTARTVKTRVPWGISGVDISISHVRGDQEFLQSVADGEAEGLDESGDGPININFASGDTYSGRGTITGELNFSSQSSTTPVELGGPGKLTRQ